MQSAVTDLHPGFRSGLIIDFLSEENVDRNGYDLARGPCCDKKKWIKRGDSAVFVSVDSLPSYYIEPDIDTDFDEDVGTIVDEDKDPDVLKALAKFREDFPTDEWGVELQRPARDVRPKTSLPPLELDEILEFNEFPGIIGAHKYVELRHPKLCTLTLAMRFAESHGKHGRRKLTHIDYHRA